MKSIHYLYNGLHCEKDLLIFNNLFACRKPRGEEMLVNPSRTRRAVVGAGEKRKRRRVVRFPGAQAEEDHYAELPHKEPFTDEWSRRIPVYSAFNSFTNSSLNAALVLTIDCLCFGAEDGNSFEMDLIACYFPSFLS